MSSDLFLTRPQLLARHRRQVVLLVVRVRLQVDVMVVGWSVFVLRTTIARILAASLTSRVWPRRCMSS
jgi:hypothetical protein